MQFTLCSLLALLQVWSGLSRAKSESRLEPRFLRTEPDHDPVVFNITATINDQSRFASGYIFIAPGLELAHGYGPQIYDMNANLVWDGSLVQPLIHNANVFRTCDYRGEKGKHICFNQRPGESMILDQSYRQVGSTLTDTTPTGWKINDHELNPLPGGETFIYMMDKKVTLDLEPFGASSDGTVLDGCFIEADIDSWIEKFNWCATEKVDLWEADIYPQGQALNLTSKIAGKGTWDEPWDFFHMNAIDKTPSGDYLVSARHTDTIFKIAGPGNKRNITAGTIIWRFGGKKNDFKLQGFNFSRQHDIRYVSTGRNGDIVSFFNNGWEGFNQPTAATSSGMIVELDEVNMNARLVRQFLNPDGMLTPARGGLQALSNGNALLGCGWPQAQITEFASDGTVLFHAELGVPAHTIPRKPGTGEQTWIYRAQKHEWSAQPSWKPKLLAYAETCDQSLIFVYASWNGATEVVAWSFYASNKEHGPWTLVGAAPKDGFETELILPARQTKGQSYIQAHAIDRNGNVLSTTTEKIFIPNARIAGRCSATDCGDRFDYHPSDSISCDRFTTAIEMPSKSLLLWILGAAIAGLIVGAVAGLLLSQNDPKQLVQGAYQRI